MANDNNALGGPADCNARMKQAIMLYGGVVTALANVPPFEVLNYTRFMYDVQPRAEDLPVLHAVFCYGWADDGNSTAKGWWLCKNR
jgi:hypothetical protein